MYRYIGNKTKLLPHIMEKTSQLIGNTGTVVDLMAGTGSVAYEFRRNGYNIIASDVMTYSIHHLKTNLLLEQAPPFDGLVDNKVIPGDVNRYAEVIAYLNALPSFKGFFFREFSPDGAPQIGCEPRKYFTSDNATNQYLHCPGK